VLYANAILPDGTRAMIPAEWTDSAEQQLPGTSIIGIHTTAQLASIGELLHAHIIVASLLARILSADAQRSIPKEVEPNAATTELCSTTTGRPRAESKRLVNARRPAKKRDACPAQPSARQGSHCKRKACLGLVQKKKGTV